MQKNKPMINHRQCCLMLQKIFAIALHQAAPMTVVRLFNARPDMHITDCTLLGGSPFAPRPPRDIKAALLIYSAPLSLLSIVSYYAVFVNMLLCGFRRIYFTRPLPLWLFCHIFVDIVTRTCYNKKAGDLNRTLPRGGVTIEYYSKLFAFCHSRYLLLLHLQMARWRAVNR